MPGQRRAKTLLNKHFTETLIALNGAGAEEAVVGAYALATYGIPRITRENDIWVRPMPENAERFGPR